jgi:hypothetical protein
MNKDYKITAKTIPGAIYLRYEKGELSAVLFELNAALNDQVYTAFKQRLMQGENLKMLSECFEVKELNNGRSVQDKIVMFCSAFKFHRGIPYKPKEVEKANLKNVPVTRELLETWFKSPLANYTLDNYIKRINITRDWARNGQGNHLIKQLPDDYDPTFEASLSGERLTQYWAHLRTNGYTKTDRGWVKADN